MENISLASPQQRRLWGLYKSGVKASFYTQQLVLFENNIEIESLYSCFEILFARYELFSTWLRPEGNSELVQVVGKQGQIWHSTHQYLHDADYQLLISGSQMLGDDRYQAFMPFLHLEFFTSAEKNTLLKITAPSYIVDAKTLDNLLVDAAKLYANKRYGYTYPESKILQYADLSQWQYEVLKSEDAKYEQALFRNRDKFGPSSLVMIEEQLCEKKLFVDFKTYQIPLSNSLKDKLLSFGEKEILSLWALFLMRSLECSQITVGVHHSGRIEDIGAAYGPFCKTIPIAFTSYDELSYAKNIDDFTRDIEDIFEIQECFSQSVIEDYFDEKIVYFPYAFEYQQLETSRISDLKFSTLSSSSSSEPARLKLQVRKSIDGIFIELVYDTSCFTLDLILLIAARFSTVLQQVCLEGNILDPISIISDYERKKQLLEWNSTEAVSVDYVSYHQWFEQQTVRSPNAIAVEYKDKQITFQELNDQANCVAHYLLASGCVTGEVVGLCMERKPEMVVCLLGILKAGCAYLPLDIKYPQSRLEYMIKDAHLKRVLTNNELSKLFSSLNSNLSVTHWVDLHKEFQFLDRSNPLVRVNNEDCVYVIYTSGSTGNPKGTVLTHANLLNYLGWAVSAYNMSEGQGSLVHSSISFDLTVTSLLGPLVAGQKVILVDDHEGIEGLIRLLTESKEYSLLKLTPSHLEVLNGRLSPDQMKNSVRTIVIGGEALLREQVRPWLCNSPNTRLINEYGPTETTVGCCVELIGALQEQEPTLSIGRPIANTSLYVLGPDRNILPLGSTGELYIGGKGVARGYLNRAETTAEKFVNIALIENKEAERLYCTGDLVRYLSDGRLQFLGRQDQQVKINGYRIEIGEVESAIISLPRIKQAHVMARSLKGSVHKSVRLVAYVVFKNTESTQTTIELKAQLKNLLPDHMIPDIWVALDVLPLNQNGKVDAQQLPDPEQGHGYVAPETLQEKILCKIWQKVLRGNEDDSDKIGVEDNYFSAGGDSIRSIQVLALAKKEGIIFNVEQMFSFPTIRSLLNNLSIVSDQAITDQKQKPFSMIKESDQLLLPDNIEDAYPITVLQGGMIFHNELDEKSTSVYHDIFSYRLRCKVDLLLMERVAKELSLRHPVLRTTFDLSNFSEPLQLVHSGPAPIFEFEDIRHLAPLQQEEAIKKWITDEKVRGFNVSKLPLARFYVHHRDADLIQFTLSFHHSVIDGWSDATMLTELFIHYLNLVEGRSIDIPAPKNKYNEYVAIEKAIVEDEHARAFWLDAVLNNFEFTYLPKLMDAGSRNTVHIQPVDIDEKLSTGIKNLSQTINVPVKNILLAAHIRVLGLLSNQADVTTCMVSSGRLETDEGDKVLGLFINSIPLRAKLNGGSWKNLAETMFDLEKKTLPYRRFPLGTLRKMNEGKPISDSLFYFTHYHIFDRAFEAGEIEFQELIPHEVSSFPFVANFHIDPLNKRVHCSLSCSGEYFTGEAVKNFAIHYQKALEALAYTSESNYLFTDLIDKTIKEGLFRDAQGSQQDDIGSLRIEEQFVKKAQERPNEVALSNNEKQWSYSALNQLSDSMANYLLSNNVKPGDSVGVCLERTEKLIISLLAIAKVGANYVPIDTDIPFQRIAAICETVTFACILSHSARKSELTDLDTNIVDVDAQWEQILSHSNECIKRKYSLDDLFYIIFTSGTTGKPKGVRISQKNVINFLSAMDRELGLPKENDAWLALTNISFDISVLEIFWTLTRGIKLVLQSTEDLRLIANETTHIKRVKTPKFSLFYFADDNSGIQPGQEKYRLLFEGARFADENHFDAVWIPERHFHSFGGLYPAPAVLAAAIAAKTKNIAIRSGSVVLPLHDPISIAEEWSVVDNISNGRIGLSLASGWNANDFVFNPENYQNRKKVFEQKFDLLRKVWMGDSLNIKRSGVNYAVELFPKPVQSNLPLWFTAAGNPATFAAAGRQGVNVLTHFLGQDEKTLQENIAIYKRARQEAGFDPKTGQVSLMIHTFVWENPAEIRNIIYKPLISYLKNSVDLAQKVFDSLGIGNQVRPEDLEDMLDLSFDRYYQRSGLFGTTKQCIEKIDRLTAIGVDEICCLIDFGVDTEKVMLSLQNLNKTKNFMFEEDAKESSNFAVDLTSEKNKNDFSIAAQIDRHNITHIQMTPSFANALVADSKGLQALKIAKKVLIGGEALHQELADTLTSNLSSNTLMNMYGPTEATVWSTVKHFYTPYERVTIGRPIQNTTAYILNRDLQILPRGVFGDLYLGGMGIAQGYQNLAEQTQARFIPDPFANDDSARLYRTGDVARLLYNGEIEFANRSDNQVKIRGYRIEPEEIENVLNTHPAIQQAIVLPYTLSGSDSTTQLVAYVLSAGNEVLDWDDVHRHSAKYLPGYMRPSTYQLLNAFPTTSNGKIDRKNFPAPVFDSLSKNQMSRLHESHISAIISNIWARILNVKTVSPDDNFFELGGFSIQVSQAIAQMRKVFKRDLALRSLFESPTPAIYAKYLDELSHKNHLQIVPEVVREFPITLPLSESQKGVWFADQISGQGSSYNEPAVVKINGRIDHELLKQSLNKLVERHETLRLSFRIENGAPVQTLHSGNLEGAKFDYEVHSLPSGVNWVPLVESVIRKPFNLSDGRLARCLLISIDVDTHILALVLHHLISDGWSMRVLLQDLTEIYQAVEKGENPSLSKLPIGYLDYVVWQQKMFRQDHFNLSLQYWKNQLEPGGDYEVLPPDYPRASKREFLGETEFFAFSESLSEQLKILSREQGVTLFICLMSIFKILLHGKSNINKIVVGTDTANRARVETEGLIGLFVNQLALKTDFSGITTVVDVFNNVRNNFLDAINHQDVPYEQVAAAVLSKKDRSKHQLFQTKFVFQDNFLASFSVGGLEFAPVDVVRGATKFEFLLNATVQKEGIAFSVEYDSCLFNKTTVENFIDQYRALAELLVNNPYLDLQTCRDAIRNIEQQCQEKMGDSFRQSKSTLLKSIRDKSKETSE